MKMAIIGSRNFEDYEKLVATINTIRIKYDDITHIVSGGARGADSLGERYAEEYSLEKEIYYADWQKHGKSAGYIRNNDIVNNSDIVVAFWDGKSVGTAHSFKLCKDKGIPIIIYNYKEKTFSTI